MDATTLVATLKEEAVPVVSSYAAFGVTLAMSTLAQNFVGISTATKMLPSLLGVATVCIASLASQKCAILGYQWCKNPAILHDERLRRRVLATSSTNQGYWEIGNIVRISKHEARVCLTGLLTYKLLGGRFRAISPSSLTSPGSFARRSLPAGEKYATTSERHEIQNIGRRSGCHTCGVRKGLFIADHMPPKSVAAKMNDSWLRRTGILRKVKYRFYPQCESCSSKQGGTLSKAGKEINFSLSKSQQAREMRAAGAGRNAHFHGLRLRKSHLVGGVLGGLTVVGASSRDVSCGNPKRFQKMESHLRKTSNKLNVFSS